MPDDPFRHQSETKTSFVPKGAFGYGEGRISSGRLRRPGCVGDPAPLRPVKEVPTEFTSASANKYLRRLQDEKDYVLNTELERCTYVLSEGEAPEPPVYSYRETRDKVAEIDRVTRILRHGLHQFNMVTVLPQCSLTIDEALIALAQLSVERDRVAELRARQPKVRLGERPVGAGVTTVEYRYANYDVQEAERDYEALSEKIAAIQLELDLANQTKTFEVAL